MKKNAFTLIELLFVVATIAILAAIAVPNFLEAQIRSKIARTISDMAVIDAALRAYEADYRAYPPNHPEVAEYLLALSRVESVDLLEIDYPTEETQWGNVNHKGRTQSILAGSNYGGSNAPTDLIPIIVSGLDLAPLTSPVAYFTHALPTEVFWHHRRLPFIYVNFQDIAQGRGLSPASSSFDVYTKVAIPVEPPAPDPFNLDPFGMEGHFYDFNYYDHRYDKQPVNINLVPGDPNHPHHGVTRTRHIETGTTRQARLITERYMLLSVGPNLRTEMITRENFLIDQPNIYDPTNGTVSTGTIHTLGGGLNLRENRLAGPR
jgi:prepilin-type N-terminal cleavage/methylation domain-containing protein